MCCSLLSLTSLKITHTEVPLSVTIVDLYWLEYIIKVSNVVVSIIKVSNAVVSIIKVSNAVVSIIKVSGKYHQGVKCSGKYHQGVKCSGKYHQGVKCSGEYHQGVKCKGWHNIPPPALGHIVIVLFAVDVYSFVYKLQ